jgi:hypothetical protein
MINYNKKHPSFFTHGMKQSKSKINFIVRENKKRYKKYTKQNKIKRSYSWVPKTIN